MNGKDRIIVALDYDSDIDALALVKKLKGKVGIFKVGKQLFTSYGPDIVKKIQAEGGKVFLDLKFHDIPNTVEKAVRAATRLGAFMTTIHAGGGAEMIKKAREAAEDEAKKTGKSAPIILAVTVLTSLDIAGLKQIGFNFGTTEEAVLSLAKLAVSSTANGLVCSPNEVSAVRKAVGKDVTIVTPGIRPAGAELNDQKRTADPKSAINNGADYLVIGRPITAAADPATAADSIIKEIEK